MDTIVLGTKKGKREHDRGNITCTDISCQTSFHNMYLEYLGVLRPCGSPQMLYVITHQKQ